MICSLLKHKLLSRKIKLPEKNFGYFLLTGEPPPQP
jgi:hypothetical protein